MSAMIGAGSAAGGTLTRNLANLSANIDNFLETRRATILTNCTISNIHGMALMAEWKLKGQTRSKEMEDFPCGASSRTWCN